MRIKLVSKLKLLSLLMILTFGLASCTDSNDEQAEKELLNPVVLSVDNSHEKSTEIGNFVTTAIQKTHNLDFVFLPAAYFHSMSAIFEVKPGMTDVEIGRVLKHFPRGPENQLIFGTMSGAALKKFILDRCRETYDKELEVAGLWYSLNFQGGFLSASNFLVDGRYPIDDKEYYRIAISDDFYFGSAFPGYKYRNGFNFHFKRERKQGYVNKSIKAYLKSLKVGNDNLPYWKAIRASVNIVEEGYIGFKTIPEIQGQGHKSPLIAKRVTTRGIVTAVGTQQWYPRFLDIYIQSTVPDGNDKTSEGLHLTVTTNNVFLELGDEIEVSGLVIEDLRANGMGQTDLRVSKNPKVLSKGNKLPAAVVLGPGGRRIPNESISTYSGLLMRKEILNTKDGIDFWESLEGMRIEMSDLKIVGFRGGGEDLIEVSNRFYLNLNVVAENTETPGSETMNNGIMIDYDKWDFNPEIITVTTNHLSKGIDITRKKKDYYHYNIGDKIKGKVEGVLIYQKNIFGGGEYSLVLPEAQENFKFENIESKGFVPVINRGVTRLVASRNELTFGTFNLENLPGNRPDRIKVVGDVIAQNLKCPDVMNLVEIQDNNGISLRGSSNAVKTMYKLMGVVQSQCPDQLYDFVNIDPFLQAEGGQPGGNIRVSMFYNTRKLSYEKRNDGSIGTQALVRKGGLLSSNPGRIYPTDPIFKRTRRSVVVEFDVLSKPGEKVYVIGNHLNSKLGDIDLWGNQQPARPLSDDKRARRSAKINGFIRWIELENPKANIVVLGDFNALPEEGSMKSLTGNGEQLRNMIFTLPKNERYTTNYNGNSQALDYIFVNHRIFAKCAESEILHINSDFMGRVSDHDPVMLRTCF